MWAGARPPSSRNRRSSSGRWRIHSWTGHFGYPASRDRGCWLPPQLSLRPSHLPRLPPDPALASYPEHRGICQTVNSSQLLGSRHLQDQTPRLSCAPGGLPEPCIPALTKYVPSTRSALGLRDDHRATPDPRLCLQSCFNHSSFLVDSRPLPVLHRDTEESGSSQNKADNRAVPSGTLLGHFSPLHPPPSVLRKSSDVGSGRPGVGPGPCSI